MFHFLSQQNTRGGGVGGPPQQNYNSPPPPQYNNYPPPQSQPPQQQQSPYYPPPPTQQQQQSFAQINPADLASGMRNPRNTISGAMQRMNETDGLGKCLILVFICLLACFC